MFKQNCLKHKKIFLLLLQKTRSIVKVPFSAIEILKYCLNASYFAF